MSGSVNIKISGSSSTGILLILWSGKLHGQQDSPAKAAIKEKMTRNQCALLFVGAEKLRGMNGLAGINAQKPNCEPTEISV
jgi:hypothetical protein